MPTQNISIVQDIQNDATSGSLGAIAWDKPHDSASYIGRFDRIPTLGQCSQITFNYSASADGAQVRASVAIRFGYFPGAFTIANVDFTPYSTPAPTLSISANLNRSQLYTLAVYMSMYNLDDGSKVGLTGNITLTTATIVYTEGPGMNFFT